MVLHRNVSLAVDRVVPLALGYVLLYNVHLPKSDIGPPVVDNCPAGQGDLEPCHCNNLDGDLTGEITIQCNSPPWTTMYEIKNMFNNVDYYPTTHVYSFELTKSNVSGILKKDIWGPLNFQNIIMQYNKIEAIETSAFASSADTLRTINLRGNDIKYFNFNDIKDLPHLEELNLGMNSCNFIPTECFPSSDIKHLYLEENEIEFIGEHAFGNLHNLRKLDLSYNRLGYLKDYEFSITENYVGLSILLSHNKIRNIGQSAFANTRLALLDLSHNNLTTLDQYVFMPIIDNNMYSELTILVTDNLIKCNCNLAWISQLGANEYFSNFMCRDSGNATGVMFHDLDPAFFDDCY